MSSFIAALIGGGLLGIVLVLLIFARAREETDRRMRNLRTRVISLEIQRDRVAEELERTRAQLAETEAARQAHDLDRERVEIAERKAERLWKELERAREQAAAATGSRQLTEELEVTRAELAERERQLARRELIVVIDHNRVNDLQAIKGIGPKLAETLVAEGIEKLADLAHMTDEDLDKLAVQWPALAGRIRREGWRAQAAILVEEGAQADEFEEDADGQGPDALPVELPNLSKPPEREYPRVVMG